jgi:uncharacterized RDD family membrane protein YckC
MRVDTISESAARPVVEASGEHAGTFRARVGGYVVDMVIFAAIAMLMFVLAGIIILVATANVTDEVTNADLYTFIAIIGLGTPLVWSLLNLALLATRGQTGGQYVAGLRLVRENGERPRLGTVLAWWFSFNPLLFSWPMAIVAAIPLGALLALVLNVFALFVLALVVLLCAVAPIVAFASGLADGQNRALHDRVAGVGVVTVDVR